MTFTNSKGTMLPTSIDVQMYLCRSSNHKMTKNMSTHFSSNAKHKYELMLYNTTCTIHRSALILINCLLNFSSSILTCNLRASTLLTFYLYLILQISILMDFSRDLRIITIFSYFDFQNKDSKKKTSSLEIEDLKTIDFL